MDNSDLLNSLRELNVTAMNRIAALEVEVASLHQPALAQIVEVLDSTHDDSTKVTLINLVVGQYQSGGGL